jgi:hypothetical protein
VNTVSNKNMGQAITPIRNGDLIPGTRLRRRWRGERETTPRYEEDPTGKESVYLAFDEAKAHGYRTVEVLGATYAFIGGEWYNWWLPGRGEG